MNHANSHIRTGARGSIDSDNKAGDIASGYSAAWVAIRLILNLSNVGVCVCVCVSAEGSLCARTISEYYGGRRFLDSLVSPRIQMKYTASLFPWNDTKLVRGMLRGRRMLKQWMEFEICWTRTIFVILSSSTDSAGRLTLGEITYSLENISLEWTLKQSKYLLFKFNISVARCSLFFFFFFFFLTLDGCRRMSFCGIKTVCLAMNKYERFDVTNGYSC